MTTLDMEGNAVNTDLEDKKVKIRVDEALILKLRPGYFSLLTDKISDAEKKATFLELPGAASTYRDLVRKEVEIPLQIYDQHFTLKKPVRYTKPSLRLETLFTKSLTRMHPNPNFSKYILSEMQQHAQSKGIRDSPYLDAGHMLTRIAYWAL